ncbi:hypothetical protein QJS10_CPB13g00526 [Acorus calamus]|uniref:Pentatricopeptide repeat-containing protein n=1 Tax=Acorus calamus TaxID=4465 RepID=A0AAV9DFY7_ACOCL|nr:hypothetical protein QJS10_CPB13g00526 [Acorus calamus]
MLPENMEFPLLHKTLPEVGDENDKAASDENKSSDIEGDSVDYSKHICELCDVGRFKSARRVFDEMMKKGIDINRSTYITMMDSFIKRQKRMLKGAG